VDSLRRLIGNLEFEIEVLTKLARGRLARDPGYLAIQQIPGVGGVLGAVFVAEIGDVTRVEGWLPPRDPSCAALALGDRLGTDGHRRAARSAPRGLTHPPRPPRTDRNTTWRPTGRPGPTSTRPLRSATIASVHG